MKERKNKDEEDEIDIIRFDDRYNNWRIIETMIKDGVVYKENDILIINQPLKNLIDSFFKYLKSNKELKKYRRVRDKYYLLDPTNTISI